MMTGGLTESKPATPEIQKIVDQVKSQLEGKENKTYSCFQATEYRRQVVAGMNYFIKVKPQLEEKEDETYPTFEALEYRRQVVAGMNYLIKVSISDSTDDCVHLKVFESLPDENQGPSLTAYQTGKTTSDPLTDFD